MNSYYTVREADRSELETQLLSEFIKDLTFLMNRCPENSDPTIAFWHEGDGELMMHVSYKVPETPEEEARRVIREDTEKQSRYSTYLRLSAEFGGAKS